MIFVDDFGGLIYEGLYTRGGYIRENFRMGAICETSRYNFFDVQKRRSFIRSYSDDLEYCSVIKIHRRNL